MIQYLCIYGISFLHVIANKIIDMKMCNIGSDVAYNLKVLILNISTELKYLNQINIVE